MSPPIQHQLRRTFGGLVLAIALTGCGDTSKPVQGVPAPSTRSAPRAVTRTGRSTTAKARATSKHSPSSRFVATAEAICGRLNAEITATPPNSTGGARALGENATSHGALELAAARKLGKLEPPGDLARQWVQIVRYRTELAQSLIVLGHDVENQDARAIARLATAKQAAHAAMSNVAHRAEFKQCARIGTAS